MGHRLLSAVQTNGLSLCMLTVNARRTQPRKKKKLYHNVNIMSSLLFKNRTVLKVGTDEESETLLCTSTSYLYN